MKRLLSLFFRRPPPNPWELWFRADALADKGEWRSAMDTYVACAEAFVAKADASGRCTSLGHAESAMRRASWAAEQLANTWGRTRK